MSEAALRLVTNDGEIVEAADVQEWRERCEAAQKLASERFALLEAQSEKLTKLTKDAKWREAGRAKTAAKGVHAANIRDVLLYHGSRFLGPNFQVIPDSAGWRKVEERLADPDARTGKPAWDVEALCESVDGAWLDDWYRKRPQRKYADYIFRDSDTVRKNIDRLREANGRVALQVRSCEERRRDEFLTYLSEECEGCGHLRVVHLDGRYGCGTFDGQLCPCEGFSGVGERIAGWRETMSPQGEQS